MQHTRKAALTGTAIAGGFFVAAVVLTGLLPNPLFDRYVPRSGTDVLFLLLTTLLLGVYTTQQYTRVDCAGSLSASLSGLGGYFAVSCPYCLPVVAGALSTPVITAYLVPIRPVVGLASVAVLTGVILARQRQLVTEGPAVPDVDLCCPTCGTVLKDATDPPDPEFTDGRMQMDVHCPGCDDHLAVVVEAASGDGIDIRKRVERTGECSDQSRTVTPYWIGPNDGSDGRE